MIKMMEIDDIKDHPLIQTALKLGIPLVRVHEGRTEILATINLSLPAIGGGYDAVRSDAHKSMLEVFEKITKEHEQDCVSCDPLAVKGNETIQ